MDYNARFYSPSLGRFVQPDTIIPGATNTQSWNRYAYVMNSPIMYNDPTGHICIGNGDLCTEDIDSNGWWWHESMADYYWFPPPPEHSESTECAFTTCIENIDLTAEEVEELAARLEEIVNEKSWWIDGMGLDDWLDELGFTAELASRAAASKGATLLSKVLSRVGGVLLIAGVIQNVGSNVYSPIDDLAIQLRRMDADETGVNYQFGLNVAETGFALNGEVLDGAHGLSYSAKHGVFGVQYNKSVWAVIAGYIVSMEIEDIKN
jgi:hypothetical protein